MNLIPLQEGERVVALQPVREFSEGAFVVMATMRGLIKKTSLQAFANIRSSGIIALTIQDDDALVGLRITEGSSDLLLGTRNGWAIRFREANVRPMGRAARGVRGIRLRNRDDFVVGMAALPPDRPATLLTVCEHGFGKRTTTSDYPTKNRGGKGVITIKTTERNGKVIGLRLVTDENDLMLITSAGKTIRMPVDGIPTIGRNTQGVRLIRLEEAETVVAMERLAEMEEGSAKVSPRWLRHAPRSKPWRKRISARRRPTTRMPTTRKVTMPKTRAATKAARTAATNRRLIRARAHAKDRSSTALFERRPKTVSRRRELAGPGLHGGGRHACLSRARSGRPGVGRRREQLLGFLGLLGPLILGHADPDVVAAIEAAARHGTSFGASTEREVLLGEAIRDAVPRAGQTSWPRSPRTRSASAASTAQRPESLRPAGPPARSRRRRMSRGGPRPRWPPPHRDQRGPG